MQQKINSKLCGDKDEIINHVRSECRELIQEEDKTRRNFVGKMIHCELCKNFIFCHNTKWYMHNPEAVLKNKRLKIL